MRNHLNRANIENDPVLSFDNQSSVSQPAIDLATVAEAAALLKISKTGTLGNEYYIFTGDGDFEMLARKLMEKGVKVTFVSHAKVINRAGVHYGRYSKRLRELVAAHPSKLSFQEINNWRRKLEKAVS